MRKTGFVSLAIAGLIPGFSIAATQPNDPAPQPTLFDNVRLFDGTRDTGIRDVLIADGRIVSVARHIAAPTGAKVIDGAGLTLMPGLIDAHVHDIPGGASDALRFGVTSEFDLYGWPTDQPLRKVRRASYAPTQQADLWSAGFGVTPPGGHPTEMLGEIPAADQPPTLGPADDPAAFIAARVREGSDYIKVIEDDGSRPGQKPWLKSFGPVRFKAVMQAAVASGKQVIVHSQQVAVAEAAVRLGASALAHAPCDNPGSAKFYRQMRQKSVRLIPTLAVYGGIGGEQFSRAELTGADTAPWLSPFQTITLGIPIAKPQPLQFANAMEAVRRAHRAGVVIMAGTDAPNPTTAFGVTLHVELELLVKAGLSPVEALRAATANPAGFYGATDRGRIAPGLRADLVLVSGNPMRTITATRSITAIWKNGYQIDRTPPADDRTAG